MANIQQNNNLTPEIQEAFKPEVLDVIRNSIAPTASDSEFMLFAHKAASYGLDPFKNEIFFIKYGNTARIQFAAEAYLSKAREKEGFEPPNTQMIHENDEFEMGYDAESQSQVVTKHTMSFPRGKIIGAYCVAHRKGYRPVTSVVDIDEVQHMFTGQNKDNWNKWTADMMSKFIQQRALKKQYGLEFEDVTLDQGQEPDKPKERRDITDEVNSSQHQEPEIIDPPKEETGETESEKMSKERTAMTAKFKKLGITTKDEMSAYIDKHGKLKNKNKATLGELVGLNQILDMQIESQETADDELEE